MKAHKKWAEIEEIPHVFELKMTVSSSDLAIAEGSAAQVLSLTRTRQGAISHLHTHRHTPQSHVKVSHGQLRMPGNARLCRLGRVG